MGIFYCVAIILIAETVLHTQALISQTCEATECATGTTCRYVVPCETCQFDTRCIQTERIPVGVDSECQGGDYSLAILLENSQNRGVYILKNCTVGCPNDSKCVNPDKNFGSCCTEKVDSKPAKPGLCPKGDFSTCGGDMCQDDYDCPYENKCCPGCGKMCKQPVKSENLCEGKECAPGQVCVTKQRVCRQLRTCDLVFSPVCVPKECAKCNQIETCQSIKFEYRCIHSIPLNGVFCGGCLPGQACLDTGVRCVNQQCRSYQCV